MKKFFGNLKAVLFSDVHAVVRCLENIFGHGIGILKELLIVLIILVISPLGMAAITVAVGLMWGWLWAIGPAVIFLVITIVQGLSA